VKLFAKATVAGKIGFGRAGLPALAARLRDSRSLLGIGAVLRALADSSVAADSSVPAAFRAAMERRPDGVRDLLGEIGAGEVKLFCGEATPEGVLRRARQADLDLGRKHFKLFSTGDPFTFLGVPPDAAAGRSAEPEDVEGRNVVVVQGDPGERSSGYDLPTLVAEALQIAFAAKANGAIGARVVLPDSLDPKTHPSDPFAKLVARLANASGVDEVRYARGLSASVEDRFERALENVGRDSDRALAGVERAGSWDELALALARCRSIAPRFKERIAHALSARAKIFAPSDLSGVARIDRDKTIVFAGSANPELGRGIADRMGADLGAPLLEFRGRTPYAQLGSDVSKRPVVVVQGTRPAPGAEPRSSMALFMEALLLCQEAKERGASEITLVLPYMLNARSDKGDQEGVGAYAALVAAWIDGLGLGKVVLVEPHAPHVPAFFRKNNVRVVSGSSILCNHIIERLGKEDLVMVRPDDGAAKRTRWLADQLSLPLVNGDKTRDDNNEHAELRSLSGSDVEGKRCLIFDDEIATGTTMLKTLARLTENRASEAHVAISHANLPLDPDERGALLRKLIAAGPSKRTYFYFLDTQPMGRLADDVARFVKVVSAAGAIASKARTRPLISTNGVARVSDAPPALKKKTVFLFGTSANPPTGKHGHTGIVAWGTRDLKIDAPEGGTEQIGIDETWVLPVYVHPFAAKQRSKRNLLPFEHRMNMSRLSFESIPGLEGRVKVMDTERVVVEDAFQRAAERGAPESEVRVGTIDVVRKLIADHPDCRFVLGLGADDYADLRRGDWKESAALQALVPIVVIPRKGVSSEATCAGAPELSDISASRIRASKDLALLERELEAPVTRYLLDNGLWPLEQVEGEVSP
jgi:ribose-phosphate pyrophosphokinase